MEEFMRDATESDSGLVNQVMPLIKKLRQHLSDSYGQKMYNKRETFIIGFLNKCPVLEAAMESLGEEEDDPVPTLELEDKAASVIDAYDFVGFAELERKIQKWEKVMKLQKVAEEVREGGGSGGGEEVRGLSGVAGTPCTPKSTHNCVFF